MLVPRPQSVISGLITTLSLSFYSLIGSNDVKPLFLLDNTLKKFKLFSKLIRKSLTLTLLNLKKEKKGKGLKKSRENGGKGAEGGGESIWKKEEESRVNLK